MDTCPCGSNISYEACCRPLIMGERPAATAEQLMRSRYVMGALLLIVCCPDGFVTVSVMV